MNAYLIKNGKIYDPLRHEMRDGDVLVEDGKFAETLSGSYETIDASGCIVTSGLIDYHVHYFNHGTENGVNADVASFPCGITTAVDAGSVGSANYEIYKKSAMAFSDVRILNMLFMGSGGQITDRYPEQLDVRYYDMDKIRHLFSRYPDNLVGLKLKLSRGILDADEALKPLDITVSLAEELGCNVSVHVTDPVLPIEAIAGNLRKGDVICHIYQGKGQYTLLDAQGAVREGILKARERGVVFDSSNGCNNYDIEVCRKAVEHGFMPDIISSDNNTSGYYMQPLHSLPRIMSKFLTLGMKLEDVLDAVTVNPARLIHREGLASLEAGTAADLAILKLKNRPVGYMDKAGHTLEGQAVIVPQLTMKDGSIRYCQADFN